MVLRKLNCDFQALIGVGVLLFSIAGCDKNDKPKQMVWRTDVAPLEKRLPLLAPIESCIWQWHKVDDSVRRDSAFEFEYIGGYISISSDTKNRILQDYDWESARSDVGEIPKPVWINARLP